MSLAWGRGKRVGRAKHIHAIKKPTTLFLQLTMHNQQSMQLNYGEDQEEETMPQSLQNSN